MKIKSTFLLLLLSTLLLTINSCKKDDPDPTCTNGVQDGNETGVDCGGTCTACNTNGCNKEIVHVGSAAISTATTWDSCHIYHCTSQVRIAASGSLTIEAGTIVKFDDQNLLSVDLGGMLTVNGSAGHPVIFTSEKDDSHGGDTNGDGTATSPQKGDWQHITFGNSSGNSISYSQILYAGYATNRYEQALNMGSGENNSITNSVIAHTAGGADQLFGALNMSWCPISCVAQNNTFFDNGIPVLIGISSNFDDSNVFHNPADLLETNLCNGIFVDCTHTTHADMTWTATEVAYAFSNHGNSWAMVTGKTLTLGDDVVLKFQTHVPTPGFSILMPDGDSQLQNNQGSGVVFTAYDDDDYKGDTNGDGFSSSVDGYWAGLSTYGITWYSWSNILYDEH